MRRRNWQYDATFGLDSRILNPSTTIASSWPARGDTLADFSEMGRRCRRWIRGTGIIVHQWGAVLQFWNGEFPRNGCLTLRRGGWLDSCDSLFWVTDSLLRPFCRYKRPKENFSVGLKKIGQWNEKFRNSFDRTQCIHSQGTGDGIKVYRAIFRLKGNIPDVFFRYSWRKVCTPVTWRNDWKTFRYKLMSLIRRTNVHASVFRRADKHAARSHIWLLDDSTCRYLHDYGILACGWPPATWHSLIIHKLINFWLVSIVRVWHQTSPK